jgi:hypothetical protein
MRRSRRATPARNRPRHRRRAGFGSKRSRRAASSRWRCGRRASIRVGAAVVAQNFRDPKAPPRRQAKAWPRQPQRPPRRERGPRRRGPPGERREGFARPEGAPGQEQRRDRGERRDGQQRSGPPRDGQPRDAQPREARPGDGQRRDRDRERGPRQGKGGGKGFGGKGGDRDRRDGRRDKPAPKLYSFESVVDRGFEDVAAAPASGEGEGASDGESQSQTRRIDWTIVKRTVADQRAAKTVSALYILKREGAETEFPNLGAARAAVNKTIVHPEKLTRPKTDYPTTKK